MAKMIKYYKGSLVEYEIFKLVDFYDPVLRQPTIPVKFDTPEDIKNNEFLAFSMAETLQELSGLGLSANQVGRRERMCVINIGKEIWTMFNPVIVEKSMVPTEFQEGCLSYPGLYLKIGRPDYIKVRFHAVAGQVIEKEVNGLTAVCIQHELDHLDGIVYTDLISPIKLEQAKRKVKTNLKKMKRISAEQYSRALDQQNQDKLVPVEISPSEIVKATPNPPVEQQKTPEKFVYNIGVS